MFISSLGGMLHSVPRLEVCCVQFLVRRYAAFSSSFVGMLRSVPR